MERPIIFNAENVKAILDGRKTMTRRVIKDPRRPSRERDAFLSMAPGKPDIGDIGREIELTKNIKPNYPCPYGQVGDRLWVRETFWIEHDFEFNEYSAAIIDCGINLAEDDWARVWYCATDEEPDNDGIPPSVYSKRPSIFMPRWASRLTLEITGVRVERLQEITEEDAQAEGVLWCREGATPDARHHFMVLWDSLNAKRGYGWETNPWVWVNKFKMLEGRWD